MLAAFLLLAPLSSIRAQDLEPRAFSPVPVRVNFAAVGYAYSFGNVLLDPSLPVEDATANVHTGIAGYVRTFSFFGKSAKAEAITRFAHGDWRGKLAGQDTSRSITAFGDPSVRLAVNFVGAPALEMPRFMTHRQGTVVGASLRLIVPLGQYDNDRIINLGTNRWTFIPRVGVSRRLGSHWNLEAIGSAWIFTDNPDARGQTLQQDPLWTIQGSVAYLFKGGAWLSVDAGWGSGGRASVGGEQSSARQENTRFGATLAYPLTRRASLKLAWVSGISTRLGADFDNIVLLYQYRWGGGI
jgi:hypothetical protein